MYIGACSMIYRQITGAESTDLTIIPFQFNTFKAVCTGEISSQFYDYPYTLYEIKILIRIRTQILMIFKYELLLCECVLGYQVLGVLCLDWEPHA